MDNRRTELRFSMLEGLQLQKGIRLLEIGCGLGGLLNRIKVSFPDLKVVGLDDSQKMVDCMLGQGLEAHQNSSAISGKFDRVIAHHVIEHFKHPEDFHKVLQEFCDPWSDNSDYISQSRKLVYQKRLVSRSTSSYASLLLFFRRIK